MKKESIRLTAPIGREGKTEDQAHQFALKVAGWHFTKKWVDSAQNPKLRRFDEDAESCLTKLEAWNGLKIRTSVWVVIAITLFGFAADQCYKHGLSGVFYGWLFSALVILGIIVVFVGSMYTSCRYSTCSRPGDTAMAVARAWRPLRKKAIKAQIIKWLAYYIRHHSRNDANGSRLLSEIEGWNYGGEELTKQLGYSLEQIATKSADELKNAERDGIKKVCRQSRDKFSMVDKIGQALGFERLDWAMLNQ